MPTHPRKVDRVLDVLSHRHRRRLLASLSEQVPAEDAKNDLVALDEAIPTDGDAEQVRMQFVHCHLPKLEEYGYIRWDRDAGTIAKGTKWDTLEPFLDFLTTR